MTDEQWNQICEYVRGRLKSEADFKVDHHEFEEAFDPGDQYYKEMVKRAGLAHPDFYFECPMKTEEGEPFDHLRFYQRP